MKVFENRTIVLLSKHGKEKAIQPIMESETGCNFIVENQFDTDTLGTFTREITREKSQLETAREKIKICMDWANSEISIASEGSFGPHPMFPIPWNVEIILLYDKRENYEIFGIYKGPETNFDHIITCDWDEAVKFAQKVGFPEHFLILRPSNDRGKPVIKDIDTIEKFEKAFKKCKTRSLTRNVFIETDMRAHANPTRMKNIELATKDLVKKLNNFCPKCGFYGFVVSDVLKGLPCGLCGLPSDLTKKYIYSCHKCSHKEEEVHPHGEVASPQYCHNCNP
ncbi:MAG: hypothetical protein CVU94_06725 [Firmicutes bacterium HGW-Firmicutes-19]|jgi:ribosomal protein S27AE|nr:hypothetical protein [Erysipelothrix sp.]MDP2750143.1 hypothetical protein [Nanoarchaeota archaeon]PKM67199.1 MAG: hypothetical protein CVU94_06725 [Firmicutes bacterium HGW-Firmicutes-19]